MTENGYKKETHYTFEIDGVELRIDRFCNKSVNQNLFLVSMPQPTGYTPIVFHMERVYHQGGARWQIDQDCCKEAIDDIEHFITDGASKIESYINEHGAPPIEE